MILHMIVLVLSQNLFFTDTPSSLGPEQLKSHPCFSEAAFWAFEAHYTHLQLNSFNKEDAALLAPYWGFPKSFAFLLQQKWLGPKTSDILTYGQSFANHPEETLATLLSQGILQTREDYRFCYRFLESWSGTGAQAPKKLTQFYRRLPFALVAYQSSQFYSYIKVNHLSMNPLNLSIEESTKDFLDQSTPYRLEMDPYFELLEQLDWPQTFSITQEPLSEAYRAFLRSQRAWFEMFDQPLSNLAYLSPLGALDPTQTNQAFRPMAVTKPTSQRVFAHQAKDFCQTLGPSWQLASWDELVFILERHPNPSQFLVECGLQWGTSAFLWIDPPEGNQGQRGTGAYVFFSDDPDSYGALDLQESAFKNQLHLGQGSELYLPCLCIFKDEGNH